MYADDHVPMHVHVKCPNFKAKIDIETLEVLRGDLPRAVLDDARDWIVNNRLFLRRRWRELNERDG
jgi:hypothetical protein